jgi:hypothetical protein
LFNGIIHLEASDPQVAELLAHPQMFRMGGVGLQGAAVGKLGDEDNVAGVIDIADIDADLDMGEAVDPALEALKQGFDLGPGRQAFCGLIGPDISLNSSPVIFLVERILPCRNRK